MPAVKSLSIAAIIALFVNLAPGFLLGETPSLILYDAAWQPHTSPDNSLVYEAEPGEKFFLQVSGPDPGMFALYMSLYKTPYPQSMIPPPLLLLPPWLVVEPLGPLGPGGTFTGWYALPEAISALGYDLDIYVQGFTYDSMEGFRFTNGMTLRVVAAKLKARVAYAWGSDLSQMFQLGERIELHAGDNEAESNGGLKHGGAFIPDKDLGGDGVFQFNDSGPAPEGYPEPSFSIYLNGIFPLIPGDAGFEESFAFYPQVGSSPHIYSRDRICRNNENRNLQHLVIPVHDGQGQKTHDLNLYHFKFKTKNDTYEYGFMVLDVMNNDFYELSGTRKEGMMIVEDDEEFLVSPWEPYVAVSPDGRYMAAVLKTKRDAPEIYNWKDDLYVIKLLKDDTWQNVTFPSKPGEHARKVQINPKFTNSQWATRVYPESLIFAGQPDPHALFFVTNRYDKKNANPNTEPPPDIPATLWRLKASLDDPKFLAFKAKEFGFMGSSSTLPKAGGGTYPFIFFGHSIRREENLHTELKWIRSRDDKDVVIRGAGRRDPDSAWAFDLLAFRNITCDASLSTDKVPVEVINFTGFPEVEEGEGFYIDAFGHSYSGFAKAALGEPDVGGTSFFAFTARNYAGSGDAEDLYVASIDGLMSSALVAVTSINYFEGDFAYHNRGKGIFDPFFIDANSLVFFCGRNEYFEGNILIPTHTDLFLYRINSGELRNLTQTGRINDNFSYPPLKEPEPPFTVFGTLLPFGLFPSEDGRYLFFFRAATGKTYLETKKMNLVGIDRENDYSLFDITGGEFSQGAAPDLDFETGSAHNDVWWRAEAVNLLLVTGEKERLMFFTAKYLDAFADHCNQVFRVDLETPAPAIPLTCFVFDDDDGLEPDENQPGLIDNLVVDPSGAYLAFSRSDRVHNPIDGTEGAWEDLYMVQTAPGVSMECVTSYVKDYEPGSFASVDGSLRLLENEAPEIPVQFIYAMGTGGAAVRSDNPDDARIWLFPVMSYACELVKPYPLTEEGQYLLCNVLPVE
ncbi:MAG: hypothetical protein ACYTG7_14980 [Planctomycetota bacterium]|jgi:hypothetical protein